VQQKGRKWFWSDSSIISQIGQSYKCSREGENNSGRVHRLLFRQGCPITAAERQKIILVECINYNWDRSVLSQLWFLILKYHFLVYCRSALVIGPSHLSYTLEFKEKFFLLTEAGAGQHFFHFFFEIMLCSWCFIYIRSRTRKLLVYTIVEVK
jgi:hypothetical protein